MKLINPALVAIAVVAVRASTLAAQTPDSVPIPMPSIDARASRSTVPPARLPFAITTTLVAPLHTTSATSADAALRGIPGVQVSNRFNDAVGERITIRGMGARAQFGIRGIRVLVDGIPATMPDGQTTLTHLDAAAVTSSEVLRGPAGALWGNASGGVVELRTAPLSTRLAEGLFTYGANGLTRGSGAVAFAPSPDARVHARVTTQQHDGFRAHASARKTLAGIGGSWQNGMSTAWISAHAVDYDAENPGSLSQVQLDSARTQANPNNVRQMTRESGRHGEVGAGWQRAVGAGSFGLSAYALHRTLDNPIPPTIIDLARNAGGARAVFGTSARSRIIGTAGVEGGLQSDDRENHVNTLGTRGTLTLDQAERVTYAAAFAQAVAGITQHVDALVAVRTDHYRFRASDHLINAGNPDDSGTRTMNAPSATVGVRARSGRASIYSNYATSFQTPTTTELANRPDGAGGFNPELEPERTHGLEVGGDVVLGSLRVEAAAYRAHVRNALIPFEVPGVAGRQFFRNAGSVNNAGVELGARIQLMPSLAAAGALTRTASEFDTYVVGTTDYSGKRVPGVAGTTGDAEITWQVARSAALSIALRHSSDFAANDANTATSPGYDLIDAAVEAPTVRIAGIGVHVRAGVNNLAGTDYNAAVSINAAGSRYFEPGPGRSFYVGLAVLSGGTRGAR